MVVFERTHPADGYRACERRRVEWERRVRNEIGLEDGAGGRAFHLQLTSTIV